MNIKAGLKKLEGIVKVLHAGDSLTSVHYVALRQILEAMDEPDDFETSTNLSFRRCLESIKSIESRLSRLEEAPDKAIKVAKDSGYGDDVITDVLKAMKPSPSPDTHPPECGCNDCYASTYTGKKPDTIPIPRSVAEDWSVLHTPPNDYKIDNKMYDAIRSALKEGK
jgi:hypothetical protein